MDKITALKLAKDYTSEVMRRYPIEKAILFGSFAKGNFNDDSDIDIAFVWDFSGDLFTVQRDLMKLRRAFDFRIEPHPFALTNFSDTDPLVHEILKHGVVIDHHL